VPVKLGHRWVVDSAGKVKASGNRDRARKTAPALPGLRLFNTSTTAASPQRGQLIQT